MEPRLQIALDSLEGLSVGDAFGQQFFIGDYDALDAIDRRHVPPPIWRYTDDTQMALSVVSVLRQCGEINHETLAASFGARYDSLRGYGPAMDWLVPRLFGRASDWRDLAQSLFHGQGSYGNGAAMRAAPIGAYFAGDGVAAAVNAARSAQVTHAHVEAIAGAVAVAVAASLAASLRGSSDVDRREFLCDIASFVPDSEVKARMIIAANLPDGLSVLPVVAELGNGSQTTAMDTVPFALWCAAESLVDYEEAMWLTVSGLGDRDTTCAIVGGIVAAFTGADAIPASWRSAREWLPTWRLREQIEW